MAKSNHFDVLLEMINRDLDIQLAPLTNVTRAQMTKKGTLVTIGVGGDQVARIVNGGFVGGLVLANSAQFDEIWARMKKEDGE